MHRSWTVVVVTLLLVASSLGWAESPPGDKDDIGTRWYVYRDAEGDSHGYWTNWMPENAGQMIKLNLADTTDPASGSTAVRVTIHFQPPNWGGIAVASRPDYWGVTPSNEVFDLSRAKKLVFYARSEKDDAHIQVKVAITGDKPYGDSAKIPAATEWLRLTKSWKKYELPVKGSDLKRVITPFVVVADRAHNPSGVLTFWLDDIYFVLEDGK